MRHNLTSVTMLAVLLAPIPIAPRAAAKPKTQVTSAKQLVDLPARWKRAMEDFDIPGMAVAVIRDDDVVMLETLGVRDPVSRTPVTQDTVFYLASCTKAFTATAILQLVEQGTIDLDAPVRTYLPRFELADRKATEEITVRELLSHARGLSSDPIVWLEAFTGEITEDRFYRFLKEVKPTGSFRYSNLHYTLAGRIISAVTGKNWKDVLEDRIFRPLGMDSSTCYADEMYARSDVAIPSVVRDGRLVPALTRKNDSIMHAAGGHGASIKDLVIWMRFNLTGRSASGRPVLSAESLHEMHEPQAEQSRRLPIPGQTRTGYGLGWNIGEYKGKTVLEHGGSYVGTSAAISFLPEEQIGVAVLLNAQSPLTLVFTADVFDRLLGVRPTDILPRMKKGYDRSKARRSTEHGSADSDPASSSDRLSLDPRAYVGRYANHMWGTIKIDLQDRRLVARMGTLPLELVLHGTDRFSVRNSGGTPIAGRFVVHADSTVGAVLLAIDEEGNEVAFDKQ